MSMEKEQEEKVNLLELINNAEPVNLKDLKGKRRIEAIEVSFSKDIKGFLKVERFILKDWEDNYYSILDVPENITFATHKLTFHNWTINSNVFIRNLYTVMKIKKEGE